MNIHTLHIYGYGKFTNQTFRLSSSNLHLIYGLNESGKTTLMSFIESMLFGFPKTKRYEPKAGGIYGGMLEAVHPAIGHIRIERTAGRPEKVNVFWKTAAPGQRIFSSRCYPIWTGVYIRRFTHLMYSAFRKSTNSTATKSAGFCFFQFIRL